MKRVLIVKEGQWGDMKPEEYQTLINYFQRTLETAEFPSLYQEGRKEKAAEVRVIEAAQDAEKILKTEGADAVLFIISGGMEFTAERLATLYPGTRVIVFTGLIPERKVIWIDKLWLNPELIENVVLR